ncbi:MAG: hypothetical protein ACK6DS_16400, partial [Planctomycetota bacterium]
NTSDTLVVEADAAGAVERKLTIGGTFGETLWLGTEGRHVYDEWLYDSYVQGMAREMRTGEYDSSGFVWTDTARSGTVTSQFDPEGKLLSASGALRQQIESGGLASSEDQEYATRTSGDWEAIRSYERSSSDNFRSSLTRDWTPRVTAAGELDYEATDAAFTQQFWGEYEESDTRSVWDGQAYRLPETTRTRGGGYGAGVSNPLVQTKAGGAALDLGFYNGGHHSWGYEGKAVHAHFSPATLGPGSGEDLAFWDDSANPDMAAGPSLLRQDGGGGGLAGAPGQDEGLKALALPAPNRPLQLLRQRLNGSFQSGLNLALTDQIDVESSIGEMEPGLRVRSVLALLAMADPYLNDFLGNYITKGAFNVETSGRSAMSLWLYEAAPWYDEATNTLYVPASWTAGQVVDFLTEYAHDLNNPMGKRFLAELQTNGIFSGRIGFEEYNSLLKQGLAATAEQAEGLVRQAISLGPGGD